MYIYIKYIYIMYIFVHIYIIYTYLYIYIQAFNQAAKTVFEKRWGSVSSVTGSWRSHTGSTRGKTPDKIWFIHICRTNI